MFVFRQLSLLFLIPAACAAQSQPVEFTGIQNGLRCTSRIISGSEPSSEFAFRELAAAGVKTIVSVDGIAPNVEVARKFGLRYVHIPFGYDGVPESAALQLTRVVRDCKGVIFVHCHHGKHRGPAAAAIAGIADGDLNIKQAVQFLKRAGTHDDYIGLWKSVRNFVPDTSGRKLPELVETAKVSSTAQSMAQVEKLLKRLSSPDTKTPVRTESAVLLHQKFRELVRKPPLDDSEFRKLLRAVERTSGQVVKAVKAKDEAQVKAHLQHMKRQCTECHASFR